MDLDGAKISETNIEISDSNCHHHWQIVTMSEDSCLHAECWFETRVAQFVAGKRKMHDQKKTTRATEKPQTNTVSAKPFEQKLWVKKVLVQTPHATQPLASFIKMS